MPKKGSKKTSSVAGKKSPSRGSRTLEKEILENLVQLQKVHTNLAEKFDKLAKEISSLLSLFEITAKNFAKKLPKGEMEKDKEFLEKVDKLLEQNKTIAKGLTLMEERLKERVYGGAQKETEQMQPSMPFKPRPLPKF